MALTASDVAFWGLVALWMSLAFLAWGLAFGSTGRKTGPGGVNRGRLKAVQALGIVILVISFVLFIPFFAPGLDLLPSSYITVTNASIALFVAVGIIMVSRTKAAPAVSRDRALGRIPMEEEDDYAVEAVEVVPDGPGGALEGPEARPGLEGGGGGKAPGTAPTTQVIDCPQCSKTFKVTIRSLPAAIKCPHCGVEGELEA